MYFPAGPSYPVSKNNVWGLDKAGILRPGVRGPGMLVLLWSGTPEVVSSILVSSENQHTLAHSPVTTWLLLPVCCLKRPPGLQVWALSSVFKSGLEFMARVLFSSFTQSLRWLLPKLIQNTVPAPGGLPWHSLAARVITIFSRVTITLVRWKSSLHWQLDNFLALIPSPRWNITRYFQDLSSRLLFRPVIIY